MKELICIVCPVGCHIHVDEQHHISGNKCPRGYQYAFVELTNPKRMLTTTVKTVFHNVPRLSVKSKEPVPKAQLFDIMSELNHLLITKHVKIGDIIVSNILGTGVDMVATKSTFSEHQKGEAHEIYPID